MCAASWVSAPAHLVGSEPPRGRAVEQSGDDLDVPQPGRAGVEGGRGARQERRQRLALQIDPGPGLFGRGDDPSGFAVLDAEQVGHRVLGSLSVAGEHPTLGQRGHRVHGEPLRPILDPRTLHDFPQPHAS